MEKYVLSLSISYFCDGCESENLKTVEYSSNELSELEELFDSVSGDVYTEEVQLEDDLIKYAVTLYQEVDDELEFIKEKVMTLNLKDHFADFWKLFSKVE